MNKSAIFFSLTKARLALSVVFSSIAGYILAVDYIIVKDLTFLILGGYCIVGASNSFNQIIEKDKDKLMDRTKLRPLPTKKNYNTKCILDFSNFNFDRSFHVIHDQL